MELPEPDADPDADPGPGGSPDRPGGRSSRARWQAVGDWLFRDRHTGRITVAQFPNAPLWIYLATVVLRRILPDSTWIRTPTNWIAVLALGWWALDEVLRGVNPWRRILGVGVGGLVVVGALSSVH